MSEIRAHVKSREIQGRSPLTQELLSQQRFGIGVGEKTKSEREIAHSVSKLVRRLAGVTEEVLEEA